MSESASQKRIKIYFNDKDIRKFTIKSTMKFNELLNFIVEKSNTKIDTSNISLQYEDEDKEWIIFHTNQEWSDAIEFHNDWKVPLKIKVTLKATTTTVIKHTNIVCDSCNKGIEGFRYNCMECDDFDLCSPCYQKNKGNHKHQGFDKFEKPITPNEYKEILAFRKQKKEKSEEEFKEILNVVHKDIMCDECKKESFKGPRYQCTECGDYDLCIHCYLKKRYLHFNGNHKFDCFVHALTQTEEENIHEERKIEKNGSKKNMKVFSSIKHYDIKCNDCKKENFNGLRYRCLDCEEYDVCSKCYSPNLHFQNSHKFLVVKKSLSEKEEEKLFKNELKKHKDYKKKRALAYKLESKLDSSNPYNKDIVITPNVPIQEETVVHLDIKCNGCEKVDFSGIRYKCLVCKEYDVCSSCYKPFQHFSGEHGFIEFKKEVSEEEEESMMKVARQKYLEEKAKNVKVVHHDIKCNVCENVDIEGTRYQCLDCDEYDVCSKCYKPFEHFNGSHKFIKFEKEVSEEEENKIKKAEKEKYENEKKEKEEKERKERKEKEEKERKEIEEIEEKERIEKEEKERKEKEEKERKEKEEKKVVHTGIMCNLCKNHDIEGTRFQCILCEDYDVCSKCYKPLDHFAGKHKFIKFEKEVSEEEENEIKKDEKEKYEKEEKERKEQEEKEEKERREKEEKERKEKEEIEKNQKSGVEIKELDIPKEKYKIHLDTLKLLGFTNVDLNLFLLEKYNGNVPSVINELKLMS